MAAARQRIGTSAAAHLPGFRSSQPPDRVAPFQAVVLGLQAVAVDRVGEAGAFGEEAGEAGEGQGAVAVLRALVAGDHGGFAAAELSGEENADEIYLRLDGTPEFRSNHAGGILGGISSGQPIVARFAVKPTSSILTPRRTIDRAGHPAEILTKGRHDPCVGIRAVPVGEAMVAIVLADHFLRHRGQTGR